MVQNTTGIGALATTGSNTFVGNQVISGSLTTTADTMTFNGSMAVSGTLSLTGSLNVLNGGFTGSLTGSATTATSASFATTASAATSITFIPATSSFALTASYVPGAASDWNSVANKPADLVSSSTQVKAFLPGGTVSSSVQYPGWVTASSQIDYNSIQNKLSDVVSSSAQVQPLLPNGTVSSSAQYPGWVTASSQIELNSITGTTFATANFTFPQNLTVAGTLTAQEIQTEYVTSSIIYESGSTKFGDTADDTHQFTGSLSVLGTISGGLVLPAGTVTASSQIDYNLIQNKLSGVVSSSSQIQPLLPAGTVSSSGQVDVRNTTGISTLATTGSNTFTATQTIIGNVFLSSSFPLVYNNDNTNNMLFGFFDGSSIYGAYYQTFGNNYTALNQRGGAEFVYDIRNNSGANFHIASFNGATWTEKFRVDDNGAHVTGSLVSTGGITGSLLGTASFATTASFALATAGTVENANTASYVAYTNIDGKPTLVSASSQIDYNSITNKLSGVYSSSAFASPNQGTVRLTLNGVQLTDVDLGVQTSDTPTFAGVSSSNHITPTADNTYNLGAPDKRWANIYTGDLILSNEGSSGNTVDGTTGNWTIQEGEEHLYIINNKSGKKFRFMLSEIN